MEDDLEFDSEASPKFLGTRRLGREAHQKVEESTAATSGGAPEAPNQALPMANLSSRGMSVRGAGSSQLAVQDAGTYQMVRDEACFLCSAILRSLQTGGSRTAVLKSAMDLARILSNRKTRYLLWKGDLLCEDLSTSVLYAVFDVVAGLRRSALRSGSKRPANSQSLPLHQPFGRTKSARRKMQKLNGSSQSTDGSQESVASWASEEPTMEFQQVDSLELRNVLSFCIWMISMDCTLSETHSVASIPSKGTSTGAQLARKLRRTILNNGAALTGIVNLAKSAPSPQRSVVSNTYTCSESPESGGTTSKGLVDLEREAIAMVDDHADSECTTPSRNDDPTAAGRRKRKQRRVMRGVDREELKSTVVDASGKRCQASEPSKAAQTSLKSRTSSSLSFASPLSISLQQSRFSSSANSKTEIDQGGTIMPDFAIPSSWLPSSLATQYADLMKSTEFPPFLHRHQFLSFASIDSLQKIVSGKADDKAESCLDGIVQDLDSELDANGDTEGHNPLLMTNLLLGKSGALAALSQYSGQLLIAFADSEARSMGDSSVVFLLEQIARAVAVMDSASLFNDRNRSTICEYWDLLSPSESNTPNECLVYCLLRVVKLVETTVDNDTVEAQHLALRTLTSLTHKNTLAAQQFLSQLPDGTWGLQVLAQSLRLNSELYGGEKVSAQKGDKRCFDCVLFCLNTLSNVVDRGSLRSHLTELQLESSISTQDRSKSLFLIWLCNWMVNETKSFAHELSAGKRMERPRATKLGPVSHSQYQKQDDSLVAAGNACILLACLLQEPSEGSNEEYASLAVVRRLILKHLPGESSKEKLEYLKSVLRAFLNFYHYSVGDLSVAIVQPVKRLMLGIDEMIMESAERSN